MLKHKSALLLQSALVGAGLIAFPLAAQAGHFNTSRINCKPVSVSHPSMGNMHVYGPTVTNNINASQNLNVYSPTHITNNINNSTNISINKPIEVYAPVTSTSNINNSSNVKITNNIDNSSNVNENLSINVTKNIAINSNNTSFTFGGSSGSHTGGGGNSGGGGNMGGGGSSNNNGNSNSNSNSNANGNSNANNAFALAQQELGGFLSNDGIETNSGIGTFN